MIGFETALAQCLSVNELAGIGLPRLVAALTTGPHHVLGAYAPVDVPRLRVDEPATVTLFDPSAEWTVTESALRSRSHNTPLLGTTVRGRVLLTLASGRVVHMDGARLPRLVQVLHD